MEIVNPIKKEVKAISFRVYANKFLCYDFNKSFIKKIKSPILLDSYPVKGCKLSCYFGEVPQYIKKLKYSIDGLGLYQLKQMYAKSRFPNTQAEWISLNDCITETEFMSNIFEGYCWYNTIVIETLIDPYKVGMIDVNNKISKNNAFSYFRKSYQDLTYSEFFDKITLCLLTEIEQDFFDDLLLSETALMVDNEIIAFPKNMATHRDGYQFSDSKTINKNKIISLIEKMNLSSNNWLNAIARSRATMLIEKDPWKKYYLGFVCLEIITHKAFEKISVKNSFDVKMKSGNLFSKKVTMPFLDFIPREDECRKLPPTTKFSLVAGVLNPEKFSDDISDFKECIKIRNEMSHGVIYSTHQLPLGKLERLLEYYSHAILKLT